MVWRKYIFVYMYYTSDYLIISSNLHVWRYFDEARLTAPSLFSLEVRLYWRSFIITSTHQIPGSIM